MWLSLIVDKWFYKYRYKTKDIRKNGSVLLRYACCQSAATSNNKPKKQCTNPAQARDVRHMTRYDCHGLLSIAPSPGFCDITLTHQFYHEPYNDISIPSQWLNYIAEKHDLGLTQVRDACPNWLWIHWMLGVRYFGEFCKRQRVEKASNSSKRLYITIGHS